MQHMERSSEKHKTHVDVDELIALNAWRPIDRQTREAIKRNFLPDLLEIYEVLPSFLEFKLLVFLAKPSSFYVSPYYLLKFLEGFRDN